ncbi:MAG: site-specific DNA-methyltransferase [Planctomycetes bacterium]|nr:site-specific DNA-methyltransferase [Planctomycetota bacterium]
MPKETHKTLLKLATPAAAGISGFRSKSIRENLGRAISGISDDRVLRALEKFFSRYYVEGVFTPRGLGQGNDGVGFRWRDERRVFVQDSRAGAKSKDVFIHENLGGYLRAELGAFVRAEIVEIENASSLALAKDVLEAGNAIVDALAEKEDALFELWTSTRKVLSEDYIVTLDLVPEALISEVRRNEEQQRSWAILGFDPSSGGTFSIDTKFFSPEFRSKLLGCLRDRARNPDGVMIHADNAAGLRHLLLGRAGGIKCVYIDPPYNTGEAGFTYRDSIDGSAWCSMMHERLELARALLADNGALFVSISDESSSKLRFILDDVFGAKNYVGTIEWNSTKSVTNTQLLATQHTHNFVYVKDSEFFRKRRELFRLSDVPDGFSNPDNDPRGPWKADPFQVGGERPNQLYKVTNPTTGEVYRPRPGCSWKNDFQTFEKLMAEGRIVFGKRGASGPQRKRFWSEAKARGRVAKTWWDDAGTTTGATRMLQDMFGESPFTNPKPVELIKRFIELGTYENDHAVLDFFAGSGTTGHACLELGKPFVLIESGAHFETVLKPRIQKAIFAKRWKNGKPAPDRSSDSDRRENDSRRERVIKYLRLESFDDALERY